MKPFDLEKAKAGAPVVTRDGRPVTEIHLFDTYMGHFPLVGVVKGERLTFTRDGHFVTTGESHHYDLFMATTNRTVWENRYLQPVGPVIGFTRWFANEDAANSDNENVVRSLGEDRIGGKAVAIEIEE